MMVQKYFPCALYHKDVYKDKAPPRRGACCRMPTANLLVRHAACGHCQLPTANFLVRFAACGMRHAACSGWSSCFRLPASNSTHQPPRPEFVCGIHRQSECSGHPSFKKEGKCNKFSLRYIISECQILVLLRASDFRLPASSVFGLRSSSPINPICNRLQE